MGLLTISAKSKVPRRMTLMAKWLHRHKLLIPVELAELTAQTDLDSLLLADLRRMGQLEQLS